MLASATLNTHVRDNLLAILSTTGNLTISTTGPHGLGTAPVSDCQLFIGGAFSPTSTFGLGLAIAPTLTAAANAQVYGAYIAPTIVEAGSGTHGYFTSLRVDPPTVTAGAAALTNAANLFLFGVPTGGTNNYALLIDANGNDGIHVALADSTDVAHGITSSVPTSVYGTLRKASATAGGLSMSGYSEDTVGAQFIGNATNVVTTETGGSGGNINLIAVVKSGTTVTTHAADDNIVVFKNSVNTTHIFKGDGSSYEDVGTAWNTYDDHDDIAVIEALEYEITSARGTPITRMFSQWMTDQRAMLERLRLATFGDDGRIFVNRSGMQALICGFARQITRRVLDLEARVAVLEAARG